MKLKLDENLLVTLAARLSERGYDLDAVRDEVSVLPPCERLRFLALLALVPPGETGGRESG